MMGPSMGSGMMRGGMGMMCRMMAGMMQGRDSETAHGGMGALFGSRVTQMMNLSVEDVRSYLALQLDRLNNKQLKIGNVTADGAIGFLNTRHDTELGDTSAASPAGCEKSREGRSTGSNNTRVAASKLLCKGQGRTIGVVTVTKPSQSPPATSLFCGLVIEFPYCFA
jgi:hypothetical protein